MKRHVLFLQWCVINMLTVAVATVALGVGYFLVRDLNIAGAIMAVGVGVVYLAYGSYAGRLAWKSDGIIEGWKDDPASRQSVKLALHDAKLIKFASTVCPVVALLGSASGILIVLHSNLDNVTAEHMPAAVAAAMGGVGVALIPTVAGLFGLLTLVYQYNTLAHALQRIEL